MSDTAPSSLVLALSVISGVFAVHGARAQTCANPQTAYVGTIISGDTCGADAMPTQNHGTITTPGGDQVFLLAGTYGVDGVTVFADPHKVFVFVCSGCGANESCVDADETQSGGVTTLQVPQEGGPYYVIVDSPSQTCSDFQIEANGPLKQKP